MISMTNTPTDYWFIWCNTNSLHCDVSDTGTWQAPYTYVTDYIIRFCRLLNTASKCTPRWTSIPATPRVIKHGVTARFIRKVKGEEEMCLKNNQQCYIKVKYMGQLHCTHRRDCKGNKKKLLIRHFMIFFCALVQTWTGKWKAELYSIAWVTLLMIAN